MINQNEYLEPTRYGGVGNWEILFWESVSDPGMFIVTAGLLNNLRINHNILSFMLLTGEQAQLVAESAMRILDLTIR
jgi:hypothetical protein